MSDKIAKEPALVVKTNPNVDNFKNISEAVRKNGNYCCCEIEKTADTMCMCKNFREQTESGFCHCGRFLKVKEYPIITILCHPVDAKEADHLAESLTPQGFIVLTPHYSNEGWYSTKKAVFDEVQRTQIYMADVVFVMNSNPEAMEFLDNDIFWAEELQKKIIYENMEEVKHIEN